MSAAKSVEEGAKVMDVSKPGKGKILTTSRPVITSIVNAPTTEDIVAPKAVAPSAAHKTILPIQHDEDEPAEKLVSIDTPSDNEPTEPEPQDAEAAEPEAPVEDAQAEPEMEQSDTSADEPTDIPAAAPRESAKSTQPESSDAAGLEAVAGAVQSKKEAIKKAEEAAQKDAALQELIDSKKYVVPIGHVSHKAHRKKHHNGWMVLIMLLLVASIGGYLAVDAGLLDVGFDVPYDLIDR